MPAGKRQGSTGFRRLSNDHWIGRRVRCWGHEGGDARSPGSVTPTSFRRGEDEWMAADRQTGYSAGGLGRGSRWQSRLSRIPASARSPSRLVFSSFTNPVPSARAPLLGLSIVCGAIELPTRLPDTRRRKGRPHYPASLTSRSVEMTGRSWSSKYRVPTAGLGGRFGTESTAACRGTGAAMGWRVGVRMKLRGDACGWDSCVTAHWTGDWDIPFPMSLASSTRLRAEGVSMGGRRGRVKMETR